METFAIDEPARLQAQSKELQLREDQLRLLKEAMLAL